MPTAILFTCPLTGLTSEPVVEETVPDGTPTIEEPEEGEDMLPAGWGQLRARVSVPNPEIVEQARLLDEAVLEGIYVAGMAQLEAARARTTKPEEIAELDAAVAVAPGRAREILSAWKAGTLSGGQKEEVDTVYAAAKESLDLPEIENPLVWEERDFPVLSPDAYAAGMAALQAAGYPVKGG